MKLISIKLNPYQLTEFIINSKLKQDTHVISTSTVENLYQGEASLKDFFSNI